MVRGGMARVDPDNDNWDYKISSKRLLEICKAENISEFIEKGQIKFAAHITRAENSTKNKQLLFNIDDNHKKGHKIPNLLDQACKAQGNITRDQFCRDNRRE